MSSSPGLPPHAASSKADLAMHRHRAHHAAPIRHGHHHVLCSAGSHPAVHRHEAQHVVIHLLLLVHVDGSIIVPDAAVHLLCSLPLTMSCQLAGSSGVELLQTGCPQRSKEPGALRCRLGPRQLLWPASSWARLKELLQEAINRRLRDAARHNSGPEACTAVPPLSSRSPACRLCLDGAPAKTLRELTACAVKVPFPRPGKFPQAGSCYAYRSRTLSESVPAGTRQ